MVARFGMVHPLNSRAVLYVILYGGRKNSMNREEYRLLVALTRSPWLGLTLHRSRTSKGWNRE
jgi:hypothetical protein